MSFSAPTSPWLWVACAVLVPALVSVLAYSTLVLLSPRDPLPHASESTCRTIDSDTPVQLPSLLDSPATVQLSVVVPAYNEADRLEAMLTECIHYLETRPLAIDQPRITASDVDLGSYEVLIVDDGSKDDTAKVALQLSRKLHAQFGGKRGQVKVAKLRRNRGKGGATKHGVMHAAGHHILFVDADGASHFPDLALLEAALDRLETQQRRTSAKLPPHGVIVGSRAHLVRTEAVVKRSFLRNFLMRCFHAYLHLLGIRAIRDTQCGFKLSTRASAAHLYPSLHSPSWIFDCELLLLASLAGVPLREVGIRWHEVDGSKVDLIKDSIKMAVDLLVIRGNYLFGRWKRPAHVDVVDGGEDESAEEERKKR
ncbi:hypothetical protein MVLG_07193 [Microbotryum lychnidis-dioicae p1A1 Lamole]|uniref:dolichyl-phosphate beta-glucosyltransferase n=1 Tax=Microbotryum lychnidis-dioicae (strain p1A1 Lamole / MvSl-1064) TaxID=683840 RepID=U5HJL3_USTV1|nr:hypothetical protein MVLG_07193 [Microbotryum lychnidis-dioicae p1A1 Lamole]|eukprot:KDE02236.1 hypothetical protein MVLG_07193 [Microbotryum lychnidis-dioicae p1A1 Lamole]